MLYCVSHTSRTFCYGYFGDGLQNSLWLGWSQPWSSWSQPHKLLVLQAWRINSWVKSPTSEILGHKNECFKSLKDNIKLPSNKVFFIYDSKNQPNLKHLFWLLFFFFARTGIWTQDLTLPKQSYHLSHTSNPMPFYKESFIAVTLKKMSKLGAGGSYL
jgi:hypothetical protein